MNVLFGIGTKIPDNSDLNDYTTPGKYYVEMGSNAATLENCPFTTAAFTMYVFTVASSRYGQLIIRNNASNANDLLYIRTYTSSGWNEWREIV